MRILRTCQNTRASRQLHTGSSDSACTALFSDNKAVFEKRCVYFLWNCVFFLRPVNRLPREEKSELTVLEISPLDWNRGSCFSDYVLTLCTSFDSVVCVSVKLQCFSQLTYDYQRSNKNNKIKDTRLFRSKRALQMFSEQEIDFSDFISNQTSNQVAAVLHLSLEPGLHWATDFFFPILFCFYTV